jgi:hypothetical protein
MRRVQLIILFLFVSYCTYSKPGPYVFRDIIGNVETFIMIDDISFMEIEKTVLIGHLCNSYLQNSRFKNIPVYIFYGNSQCRDKSNEKFFISYDRGKTKQQYLQKTKKWKKLPKKTLVIRTVSSNINPGNILKLLEFGLNNIETITKNQKEVEIGTFKWNSIDSSFIRSGLRTFNFSSRIDSVLNSSYIIESNLTPLRILWQKGQFILDEFENISSLCLPNIRQIISVDSMSTLLFDSDEAFYHVNLQNHNISSRHLINKQTSVCNKFLAVKYGSDIYLIHNHNLLVWLEDRKADQFKIWCYHSADDLLTDIPFNFDIMLLFLRSESRNRSHIIINIQKSNQ